MEKRRREGSLVDREGARKQRVQKKERREWGSSCWQVYEYSTSTSIASSLHTNTSTSTIADEYVRASTHTKRVYAREPLFSLKICEAIGSSSCSIILLLSSSLRRVVCIPDLEGCNKL